MNPWQQSPNIGPDNLFRRYRILAFLGGHMSRVYHAIDSSNEREVTIKILTREGNQEPILRKHFMQEGRIYVKLRHRGLVEGLEHDIHEGFPYMVLEYLPGQSLRHVLDSKMLTNPAQRLALMADLAETLYYVHTQNVIHLDIKPENLFLTTNDSLKLTDFGIAAVEGQNLSSAGYVLGSEHYMAPEQIQGRKVTAQTDLFAFGITFFELLTGRRPFSGQNTDDLFSKLMYQPLDTAPLDACRVPEAVANLIVRCTAKDPNARPESASVIHQEIRRLTAERPWTPIHTAAAKLRDWTARTAKSRLLPPS